MSNQKKPRAMVAPNLFYRYVLSPLVTLILILFTEYLYRHGYNISLGLPLMAMALCLFWSALQGNIISAFFIIGYGLSNPIWDTSRLAILVVTALAVAIGGGLLKRRLVESVREVERHRLEALQALELARLKAEEAELAKELAELKTKEAEREHLRAEENQIKADFVDTLNGNIIFLREINGDLIKLSLAVEMMSKTDIVNGINDIQDKTANLAQRAIGWQQLAEAKHIVKGDEE